MRSVTTPFFPAQIEGAVTLQAVLDARDGDRLPLELALYLSGELGKQVAQLQALGREGSVDPTKVWCTSKGAVVVPEAAAGEPRALGPLVYRLLSGSGEVSAWPPSYFNPSVAESLDAAVMNAINGPEDTRAMVEALNAASTGLSEEDSVTGMARLVFAVSDDPKPAPAAVAAADVLEPAAAPQAWMTPRRAAAIAGGVLALLSVLIALAVSSSSAAKPVVAAPVAAQPAVKTVREKTVEAFRAQKVLKTASAGARARTRAK